MTKIFKKLLKPTKTKRLTFFLLTDFAIFFSSTYASLYILNIENFQVKNLLLVTILKIMSFWIAGIYRINWRFVGIGEFAKISFALLGAEAILSAFSGILEFPFKVFIVDYFMSLNLTCILRALKRFYKEILKKKKLNGKRVVIVGAGNTGERIVRELKRNPSFYPIFFVDDDPNKVGTAIHDVPVLGRIRDLPSLIRENKPETAIIAIPSLSHKKIKEIFELLKESGIDDIKIVPSISRLPKEVISTKDIKDISIEDLLCREPISVDMSHIKEFISGKTVLVTGAAGSIGSEIVRQLLRFNPKKVIAFEIDETELHNLELELKEKLPSGTTFEVVVGDVKDSYKVKKVFHEKQPDLVFHAAAYKHVPLMEFFPEEAVKTNVLGTYNVALAAYETGVEKFVNISTDKAVNPTSVMGATKRIAELICSAFNSLGKTKYISVRFGNVLGSRGSVIPIFLEQIKKGGPVTVTHPEMKRYFMTIPEAVLLVLQAATMGNGGEVFVLDMGEPVKILDLAKELIKLQGLEPGKDIDIVFTGLRPGEKLFEELLTAEEGVDKTYHEKVFIVRMKHEYNFEEIEKIVDELLQAAEFLDRKRIKHLLRKYVPFYSPTLKSDS